MPLSLTAGFTIAIDAAFQGRVAVGFYYVAREVMTESKQVPGNENRVQYARSIITQDYNQFLKLAALVVTDQAIVEGTPGNQAAIPDTMILTAIRNMWNRLAGVPL